MEKCSDKVHEAGETGEERTQRTHPSIKGTNGFGATQSVFSPERQNAKRNLQKISNCMVADCNQWGEPSELIHEDFGRFTWNRPIGRLGTVHCKGINGGTGNHTSK